MRDVRNLRFETEPIRQSSPQTVTAEWGTVKRVLGTMLAVRRSSVRYLVMPTHDNDDDANGRRM